MVPQAPRGDRGGGGLRGSSFNLDASYSKLLIECQCRLRLACPPERALGRRRPRPLRLAASLVLVAAASESAGGRVPAALAALVAPRQIGPLKTGRGELAEAPHPQAKKRPRGRYCHLPSIRPP